MRKKIGITVTALALVLCFAIGGTLAWLMDKTASVQNTFTAGDVDITLTETKNPDGSENTDGTAWSAQMIPGTTYTKNPCVTVTGETDVDCYLFVKFEEEGNASTYLTYVSTLTEANGWTQGDGTAIPTNVWYREVAVTDDVKSWNLLQNDEITVNADKVTKETMDTAAGAKLTYTAYAVQKDNLKVNEAWATVAN